MNNAEIAVKIKNLIATRDAGNDDVQEEIDALYDQIEFSQTNEVHEAHAVAIARMG